LLFLRTFGSAENSNVRVAETPDENFSLHSAL
jgi:hypothetical protein